MSTSERSCWHKPELLVMSRNKPEEAVLEMCKYGEEKGPQTVWGDGSVSNRCYCAGHVHWCMSEALS